jgi:hypothetical protein
MTYAQVLAQESANAAKEATPAGAAAEAASVAQALGAKTAAGSLAGYDAAAAATVVTAQEQAAAAAANALTNPANQLVVVIQKMKQLLTGLNQGPIAALQALPTPQQEAYAQAITAFSVWANANLGVNLSLGTDAGAWPGPDTSERGISVLTWDDWNGQSYPQAAIDAQNNKNAEAWCKAAGWQANGGMSNAPYVGWIGTAGDWARVANNYLWNNVPATPGALALMDLDIYSQVFGDDTIFAYKKIIEAWVATGPGQAYDTVWPQGYAEAWNNKFQSLHSQLHIFEQVAGPLAIVGGAALTALGVSSAAGAALVGLGISDTVSSNENPPEFTPGSTSSGPIAVAQITVAAQSTTPPGPPGSGPTQIPAQAISQGQASANQAAPSALSTFPWLWAAVGVGAFGLLALIVIEA